jgi:hypothetical protein
MCTTIVTENAINIYGRNSASFSETCLENVQIKNELIYIKIQGGS